MAHFRLHHSHCVLKQQWQLKAVCPLQPAQALVFREPLVRVMQGGGCWHGQITSSDFKHHLHFKLHPLGTQGIFKAGCSFSINCLHLEDTPLVWCSWKHRLLRRFVLPAPSRHKKTPVTHKPVLAAHTSQLRAFRLETEALITPKALSELEATALRTGRRWLAMCLPMPTLLPSASCAPQTCPTYVRILSQAALTHHRPAPMRHKEARAEKTIICPGKISFPSALPEAADSPESQQESLPT